MCLSFGRRTRDSVRLISSLPSSYLHIFTMTDRRYIVEISNSLIPETDEEAIWIDREPKKSKKRSNLFDFTLGTGGIFICYLIYGILQETM
jgi:hypothetical protein